jgi:glycogen debranching enzyme
VPELGLSYVAAGAPWYMALFGRDSLLAAHFLLPTGQGPGLEVLRTLARFQGRADDPRTLEQPGKILHELRTGGAGVFGLPPLVPYYGTVDASPLFVMLLGELHRWGAPESAVLELLPAARAALDWCAGPGDPDGDGFLEYRTDTAGLANQGWKDHSGSMVHADGSTARGPIAVAEAQAYHYAALRELALLEERLGEPDTAAVLRGRADALSAAFTAAYWLPEEGLLAMALDGDKRPLAVASSNIGHCLWTGILPADVAAAAAARLRQPDLLTAWGVRTLGAQERAYDPLSYHLGSVWPHDSAICAAGLARAGDREGAAALIAGLLRVAGLSGWRLPELYGGLDADQVPFPVPTPVACSPQAWSAAAPLSLLRTALGLEPDVPGGTVRIAPLLPPGERLTAQGIALGGGTLTLTAEGSTLLDADLPPGLTLA